MLRYIAKRVLSAIITIWFIMTLTFTLMNAIPGDPFASEKMNDPVIIANMKAKYGLDKPFIEQYGTYMRNYMHGDFGISFMKKGITKSRCYVSWISGRICGDRRIVRTDTAPIYKSIDVSGS